MSGALAGAPDIAKVEQWYQQERKRGRHQDAEDQRNGETVENGIIENEECTDHGGKARQHDGASPDARPIVLTGLAAMIGAFFILDDPIFNGLAISLIFGILVSTALTLLLIPLLYFGYVRRFHESAAH